MTPEEKKAMRDFANAIGYYAQISTHHLKRSIPPQDTEALREVAGCYEDLIDTRDRLMNTLTP